MLLYIFFATGIFLIYLLVVRWFFSKGDYPVFLGEPDFRLLSAALLLLLNFLDWWSTKQVVSIGGQESESNNFLNIIIEQSPYYGDFHKLVIGSIIMLLLPFSVHLDTLLAFIFLLATILIINSVTYLTFII